MRLTDRWPDRADDVDMSTSHAIPANPTTLADPTYVDSALTAASPRASHTATAQPFGIGRTMADRVRLAIARRREARAQLAHQATTRRALSNDHRMRAEFEAHFMGF